MTGAVPGVEGQAEGVRLRVLRYIREHGLAPAGSKLLVGVSGGPDSVCLLNLLAGSSAELGVVLHAAHLDHGLRAGESDADARYVRDLCRRLGVPLSAEKVEVAALRRRHSPLEEAAREARYSFFARVAGAVGAEAVAVGHTRDDHVETVLLHLVRGSGTRGLGGLAPQSLWGGPALRLRVVRPLLEVGRAETQSYCAWLGLSPRQDVSNTSLRLLRNRVRLELLPLLRSYNPAIDDSLVRTAAIARDDVAAMEAWASQLWEYVAREERGSVHLDRAKLATCPLGLKRALLRRALESFYGSPRDVEAGHVEALVRALAMPAGARLSLLRGAQAHVGYRTLVLGDQPPSPYPALQRDIAVAIPGDTDAGGWCIQATVTDDVEQYLKKKPRSELVAWFDLDRVSPPVLVRARRRGDRFQPLGMTAPVKLQDFLVNAKVPRSWRDSVPLVSSARHIVWVVGWRIDERAKVTPGTRSVLHLRFEPQPQ